MGAQHGIGPNVISADPLREIAEHMLFRRFPLLPKMVESEAVGERLQLEDFTGDINLPHFVDELVAVIPLGKGEPSGF
jgi:hypothetical protein